MRLLNVGCGATRPGDPWTNLDNLHSVLKPGTPERANLDKEDNYVNFSLGFKAHETPQFGHSMPFEEATFDGVLCSHLIEHFDCQEAASVLFDCRRILKPGGLLVVSVPDAEYFLNVYDLDTPECAVELFGEPICPDEPWHRSFFDYALFYAQHKQILTEPALKCLFLRSGFEYSTRIKYGLAGNEAWPEISKLMNRRKFSLEMCAVK